MAPFDLSYWHDTTKTYAYLGEFGFFRYKNYQYIYKKRRKKEKSKRYYLKYSFPSSPTFLVRKLRFTAMCFK